ncbi:MULTISPECIES: hypothetical protein [Treponema]|uniref:hypothetical protein n=1 Tax=Treponema TaxID=157 RepID=UPI0002B5549E|nr:MULTISPECIES: hypothetical protein [Treponema]EMB48102.1 hypothetical protein HMPREF9729_00007 [Treponema denticola ASLM]EMD56281.1 hypothetical protein HMPREF9728_01771 [Treponema denticola US-Trep]UTD09773.1 hypothetical protein HYB91_04295 [Treponema sp. B152]
MTKVKIQSVQYEKSDTIEMQGTSADTKRYIRNGYFVKEERNGFWVLNKPSRVLAEILINNKPVLQNIKNEILNYYNRDRISQNLVQKFENDLVSGSVSLYSDSNGEFVIS